MMSLYEIWYDQSNVISRNYMDLVLMAQACKCMLTASMDLETFLLHS